MNRIFSGIMLTLLLTSMLTLTFNIQPVKAETIIVPDHYPTIQEAINAASPGDTIYVRAGTYFECLTLNKALTLVGEDRSITVIDGNRTGTVVTITANHVTVSGFTIQGSKIIGAHMGIFLDSSQHSTLINNNIENNYYGIYLRNSSINNIFRNNITENVCGITLYTSSNNSISRNNIANNNNGGGIILIKSSNNNSVYENNVKDNYNGIWFWGTSSNRIFHNNFINSTHTHAGNPGTTEQDRSFDQWDEGYPSGGNYWSGYTSVDLYSGPYQNETGSDGIWDYPYVINSDNQDRYPLMKPWQAYRERLWPMFQHDAQRTGRSPLAGPGISGNPEIRRLIGGEDSDYFYAPAISSDGTLCFSARISGKEGIYAFAPDGTQKWYYPCLLVYTGPPTVAHDGSIFFYVHRERYRNVSLLMVDPDGAIKWEKSLIGEYPVGYPAISNTGTIYSLTSSSSGDSGKLIALDPDSGDMLWTYEIQEHVAWQSPAVDQNGVTYFGQGDTLFGVNPDGTEKWQRSFPAILLDGSQVFDAATVQTPSIADDGTIYVVVSKEKEWQTLTDQGWNNGLHAINPTDPNTEKWNPKYLRGIAGPPAIALDGDIYLAGGYAPVGTWYTSLYGFDSQGNSLEGWPLYNVGGMADLLVVDKERIIYGLFGRYRVKAFDRSGNQKWSLYLPDGWRSGPLSIGKDGTLYVPGRTWLYAISPLPPTPPNQPPTCSIELQKDGVEIDEIDVGDFFDIYVGDSTDDTGIVQVRFSSDDVQDSIPTGEWTEWYDWDASSEDWNASTKINRWAFATGGDKEVWAEVKDDIGQTDRCYANIFAVTPVPNQPPVASFTQYPQSPRAGEETKLDASNSYDPDGEIGFYEWDLDGDGEYDGFTTSPIIFYYWDKGGTYSVKLRVIDDGGATDTFVKDINVQHRSLWEKAKKLFASSVKTLTESEKRIFEIIKSELRIINYPHSDDPLSDPDFYWISDNQLLFVLKKKIDPDASDLTYETLIIDILHDMKLADSVANRPWTVDPKIEKYFQNMAEINAWAEVPVILLETLLDGIIDLGGGSGIGVGPVLMLWDLCQAGVGLKLLDETFYRRALWHYFQLREMGYSSEMAFGSSPIPIKYDNVATREYFEFLWTEYGGPQISDTGGLEQEFKQQIIEQLRTVLLSGLERYKFEPYHVYRIKSPGELRVYDSQGRVTGLINGETTEEIPNSAYDDESKTALIFPATDSYYCQGIGKEEGTYKLTITSVQDGKAATFSATDIPTSVNVIHQYTVDWDALSLDEEGITVMVDSDGDGVFEHTFTSGTTLTHDEFVLQTATTIDFDPDTLNLKSEGRWVTAYIEFPEGYDVADINVSTILLNGTIPAYPNAPTAIGDYDGDGIPDLMVKFDRAEVIDYIIANVNMTELYEKMFMNITLTITGYLYNGKPFQASTTIRIVMPMP